MSDAIRVMMIGLPYKMDLYRSLARHCPDDIRLLIVSAGIRERGCLRLVRTPFESVWYLPTKRMIDEMIKFRPDVFLTDSPAYPSLYAKVYSHLRMKEVPLVTWLLGDIWQETLTYFDAAGFPTRLARPVHLFAWSTWLEFADHVLTVCSWLEKTVRERFPGKNTSVLYQGVDPEPWLAQQASLYPFKHPAVGILQDNNILPKVSGLIWFADVVRQMEDVHFYIAGGGPYTHLVEKAYLGLKNAHLVGRLPYPEEVRKFYVSTDMYVLPSGLDCCPTTILEASLCARPILASRVGGVPELIREGETGWTARNGHADGWISRIRSVLEDEELAQRTGERARSFVMEHFGWDSQATKLASIIGDLVS